MLKFFLIIFCFLINQFDSLAKDSINFVSHQEIIADDRTRLISKEEVLNLGSSSKIFGNDFKRSDQSILDQENKYYVNESYDLSFFHRTANITTKICEPKTNICSCPIGNLVVENNNNKIKNQNIKSIQFYQLELLDDKNYKIIEKNNYLIKFYDDDNIECYGYEFKTHNMFLYNDQNGKFVYISNRSKEWELIQGLKNQSQKEEFFLVGQFVEKISGYYNFNDPKNICASAKKTYDLDGNINGIDCTIIAKQ